MTVELLLLTLFRTIFNIFLFFIPSFIPAAITFFLLFYYQFKVLNFQPFFIDVTRMLFFRRLLVTVNF